MSYASLARPGEEHGLRAHPQVESCRVGGLVHSQETGSLPLTGPWGPAYQHVLTGKRKCVVIVLYFVSSMNHWQAESSQLHPTTCPQPWVTCCYISIESSLCEHLSVKPKEAGQGQIRAVEFHVVAPW